MPQESPTKKFKIAILGSGGGTNAQAIIDRFRNHPFIEVSQVISNNSSARILERAYENHISTFVINRNSLYETGQLLEILNEAKIDLVVLAGFLWLIPKNLIEQFPKKIINIHPTLLPNFGGKGMYGMYVHKAVIAAKEKKSGITIHFVNEKFDSGEVIFQKSISLSPEETAESLSKKVLKLEHQHFPEVIEKLLTSRL